MSVNKYCKICQLPFSKKYTLKEMMFGFRDEFVYYDCPGCGCLQIEEIPANIDKYYPPYYYAFKPSIPVLKRRAKGLQLLMDELLLKKRERRSRKQIQDYLLPTGVQPGDKILDVGCGQGELICRMYNMGYEHVTGTDKFLPGVINYESKVQVMKKDLHEIESSSFDLIMMHHVFEHMFFPEEELKECFRILKNGSFLMIRIPVKGYAWEKYKENWVQLDPPRHFFIHTPMSIEMLASKNGFKVQEVVYDSSAFQFEGSELYDRDIPLYHPETHEFFPAKSVLSRSERKFFKKEARRLNEEQKGDQAIFYLRKGTSQ